ncbi:MAG: hypothetical protein AAFX99_35890, partial [Myxococcota bacterium]
EVGCLQPGVEFMSIPLSSGDFCLRFVYDEFSDESGLEVYSIELGLGVVVFVGCLCPVTIKRFECVQSVVQGMIYFSDKDTQLIVDALINYASMIEGDMAREFEQETKFDQITKLECV